MNIANRLDKTLRQKGAMSEVVQSDKAVSKTGVPSAAKRITAETDDVVSQNKCIKLDDEVVCEMFDDQTMNISPIQHSYINDSSCC